MVDKISSSHFESRTRKKIVERAREKLKKFETNDARREDVRHKERGKEEKIKRDPGMSISPR